MSERVHSLLPTAVWTRALLAPGLVFIASNLDRNYQTDFWHHLARGRAMAEQGQLVDRDLFTYTVPERPFQDPNWLTQLLYYQLFSLGGLPLVQAVNALVLAVMMGLLVGLCRRVCGSLMLASGVGAFTFFGIWQLLIIRPQTFSLLLFVLLYGVLELAEHPLTLPSPLRGESGVRERRRCWLLVPPFLLALWANVHGGFPIGLVLIGCYLLAAVLKSHRGGWSDGETEAQREKGDGGPRIDDRESQMAGRPSIFCPRSSILHPRFRLAVLSLRPSIPLSLCLAAAALATLANPYGLKVYQFVGGTPYVASLRRVDEWQPASLGSLSGKVWVASVLLIVVLFALPARRPSVREVCLVLCFLPLAFGAVRMVPWWMLVTAPISASLLAANLPPRIFSQERNEPASLAAGLIFGLLLLVAALSLPWLESYNPILRWLRSSQRTENDLEAVAAHLTAHGHTARIFSRFEWSAYLGWALAPTHKVFMDTRIDMFPDDVWAQYDAVTRGRADWEQILDAHQVDCLVLDDGSYHANLLPQVERSARWERVFQSGPAVLFLHRQAAAGSRRH